MKNKYMPPKCEHFTIYANPRNILETFSIDGDTETWDFIEGGEMPNSED